MNAIRVNHKTNVFAPKRRYTVTKEILYSIDDMYMFFAKELVTELVNEVSVINDVMDSILNKIEKIELNEKITKSITQKSREIKSLVPKPRIKLLSDNSMFLYKPLIKPEYLKAYVIDAQCVKSYRI